MKMRKNIQEEEVENKGGREGILFYFLEGGDTIWTGRNARKEKTRALKKDV